MATRIQSPMDIEVFRTPCSHRSLWRDNRRRNLWLGLEDQLAEDSARIEQLMRASRLRQGQTAVDRRADAPACKQFDSAGRDPLPDGRIMIETMRREAAP